MSKKFSVLLVVLTITFSLLGGLIAGRLFTPKVAVAEEANQSKVLTVEGLRIVDKNGKLLMKLGQDDFLLTYNIDSYGVYIYDGNEIGLAEMSMGNDGGYVGIFGKDGQPKVSLMVKELNGEVSISNKDGMRKAVMGVDEIGGGEVIVSGKNGKSETKICGGKSGGEIHVTDRDGEIKTGIGVAWDESGESSSGFVGVSGRNGKSGTRMGADESGSFIGVAGIDGKVKASLGIDEYNNGTINLWDKNGNKLK